MFVNVGLSSHRGGAIAFQCCVTLLLVACLRWWRDILDAILRRACSRVRAGFGMAWRYLIVGIFGSM